MIDFHLPLSPEVVARLRAELGDTAVVTDPEKLEPFGKDATEHGVLPDLVVEATSTEQVSRLLRLANELGFPVTPRGLGTGLAGGAVPVSGGVVLSLARMNRILSIEPRDLVAVVQPGVVNLDLKNAARERNLFYPPDPASHDTCSIGGNAATNAGGPSCVKYGTTRDYVLGMEVVLPNGEVVRVGQRTRKGVVGYDLAHLVVGSEGTLGVITELTLKLIPHPPALSTLVALFPDLPSAMEAVTSILAAGHVPCAIEFLDRHCLELVGDLLPFSGVAEAGAFLLVEMDGAAEVIESEIEAVGECCMDNDAIDALLAPDSHKRARMWDVRKQVSLRIEQSAPLYIPEDVVVPIGSIAAFVSALPEREEKYGMKIYCFGHAGDGNIHLNITAGSRDAAPRVEEGIREILGLVLSMGGTISGEHGVGVEKRRFVPMELSPESIRIQKEIKRVFDPNMVLNPGKLFE